MSRHTLLVGTKPRFSVYPLDFLVLEFLYHLRKERKSISYENYVFPRPDPNNDSYVGSHIRKLVSIPTYRDIIYKDFVKYPDTACPNRHGWSHFKATGEIFCPRPGAPLF